MLIFRFNAVKKVYRLLQKSVVSLLPFILLGCSVTPTSSNEVEKHAVYSAISSVSPSFSPKQGETFTWYDKGIIWSEPEQREPHAEMVAHLLSQLGGEIQERGLLMTNMKEEADYVIGVAIIDNQSAASDKITSFFQLTPGLAMDSNRPNATVVVALVENKPWLLNPDNPWLKDSLLWRSAVEINLLAGSDLMTRKGRVDEMADVLVSQLPSSL